MIALTESTATPQATTGINRRLNLVDYPHQLFPCHWGAIIKELLVDEGEKPEWATIRYKLQATDLDRIFASENTLVGVRFGKQTKYLLIDIDIQSRCHPEVNKNEWNRLMKALEEVGLTDRIIIQSSDSGGLHVYFWFGEELETYKVAQLVWSVCHLGGFELRGGNVETFPNAKKYTLIPSMYNGHRLPLQPESGSLLLDEYFEEIETLNPWGEFCYRVQTSYQDMEEVKRKLVWGEKYHKKYSRYRGADSLCNSAADWQKSLIDRLNLGWISTGQTNELIRTACVMAWVFGDGSRNDAAIVEKLVNMPGYREFCDHQHEIERRVKDWMNCVTKQYWPYCRPDMRPFATMRHEQPAAAKPKSNKLQNDVMDRLREVVAAIVDQPLPKKISEVIQLIQEKAKEMFGRGFGINTLYSSRYASEWRILVNQAQTQIQSAFSQSWDEPEDLKNTPSNPVPESVFSELGSMKVGGLVKIAALNFLLAIEKGIDSATSFLTERSHNLGFETGCSIETDNSISFTNGNISPSAAPAAISKPNQSSLDRDSAALLLSISKKNQSEAWQPLFEVDDDWPEFEQWVDDDDRSPQDIYKKLQDSS
jgi:hypothetical protein